MAGNYPVIHSLAVEVRLDSVDYGTLRNMTLRTTSLYCHSVKSLILAALLAYCGFFSSPAAAVELAGHQQVHHSGADSPPASRGSDTRQVHDATSTKPGHVKPYEVAAWPRIALWGPALTMPMTVVRDFALPPQPWQPGHRGVDLATAPGGLVHSPADGTMTFAGFVVDRPVITVTHFSGHKSSFEAVNALVTRGTTVRRGQPIGVPVASSKCPGCVHWGMRDANGSYIDPLTVPDIAPAVLLPWRLGGPSTSQLAWR